MTTIAKQLSDLCSLVTANCHTRGTSIVTAGESAGSLPMLWLQYLKTTQLTGTGDRLLDGMASSIREVIACAALGLVRPALNSLRLQIDLALSWLYFKDHSVEWRRVQETGDGFKQKSDLLRYFSESFPRFQARYGVLREVRTRTVEEPYRLLSAHIHGQNESVLPRMVEPKDIVAPTKAQDELLSLQGECAEYINDIFWSLFADSWAAIPKDLRTRLETRFKTAAQRAHFFE